MNGILCIDKPSGWTSFDVVAKLRGIAKTKKCGHTGTLDPMATGVLPILLGSATKLASFLPQSDKNYRASFRLGLTTDTLDITGKVLSTCPAKVSRAELEAALCAFRGEITQLPPMYSAVQVNGRRLYDLARQGREVERPARIVTVHRLDLLSYDPAAGEGVLDISCSKGTYIRSLADDLGRVLGCGGILTALERDKACSFTLKDCLTLEKCRRLAEQGRLEERLLPMDAPFFSLPALRLDSVQAAKFCHGVRLDLNRLAALPTTDGPLRVYGTGFLGLARCDFSSGELILVKLVAAPTKGEIS